MSAAPQPFRLPVLVDARGTARQDVTVAVPRAQRGIYSASISVESPREFLPERRLRVAIRQNGKELAAKTLHLGDPDLYALVRPAPTEWVSNPIIPGDYARDLALHFFTKTRWGRSFRLVRGYPVNP